MAKVKKFRLDRVVTAQEVAAALEAARELGYEDSTRCMPKSQAQIASALCSVCMPVHYTALGESYAAGMSAGWVAKLTWMQANEWEPA